MCNNFFCESVYYPVQVSTGGNVTVADNLFDRIGTRPDPMNPPVRRACHLLAGCHGAEQLDAAVCQALHRDEYPGSVEG